MSDNRPIWAHALPTAILLMALDRLFGLDRLFVGTGKG